MCDQECIKKERERQIPNYIYGLCSHMLMICLIETIAMFKVLPQTWQNPNLFDKLSLILSHNHVLISTANPEITPITVISCPQEEVVFTCSASNSSIVQILWIVEFMAGSSVNIIEPNSFISANAEPRMDSLGHRYTITSLSTNPTLISILETTAAPHLNGSTVQCREFTIAGFAAQSTTSLIQVTGTKIVAV